MAKSKAPTVSLETVEEKITRVNKKLSDKERDKEALASALVSEYQAGKITIEELASFAAHHAIENDDKAESTINEFSTAFHYKRGGLEALNKLSSHCKRIAGYFTFNSTKNKGSRESTKAKEEIKKLWKEADPKHRVNSASRELWFYDILENPKYKDPKRITKDNPNGYILSVDKMPTYLLLD